MVPSTRPSYQNTAAQIFLSETLFHGGSTVLVFSSSCWVCTYQAQSASRPRLNLALTPVLFFLTI